MPRHAERRRLAHTPEQLFDLVADVDRYPEFLPWCIGSRIYDRHAEGLTADLIIGFKVYQERFTSRVTWERPERIKVDYVRGPLKYLYNDWRFEPAWGGGCQIEFLVDFEFKNRIFQRLVGAVFTEAVSRMVSSFERRADELYGDKINR